MSSLGTIACPTCGFGNIEGADECERCAVTLVEVTRVKPATPLESGVHEAKIRDLNPRAALTVGPNTTVSYALRLLVAHSVGCVVVVDDDGRPLGVFSERDALVKLNVDFERLADRPIREFMNAPAVTLSADHSLAHALHTMDLLGYRHLPITRDGHVVGVISVRDVLRFLTEEMLPGR